MLSFQDYYDHHVSLQETVDALSDPTLSHEQHREDVNRLLMNLVVRYVAEYLQAPPDDIAEIKHRAEQAVQNTTDDILQLLMDAMLKGTGKTAVGRFSQTDKLAVDSLVNIRATAAIMKEIIFGGVFEVARGGLFANNFVGVDLGHGTGILMLAELIAAKRKELGQILVIGFDISGEAVENSRRTLSKVLPSKQLRVEHADILRPEIWRIFDGLPLHCVVSETIGPSTPPIVKRNKQWEMVDIVPGRLSFSLAVQADMDPFAQVFTNALRYRPELEDDIQNGRTAMFPDLIGGSFRPNHEHSTLVLKTNTHQNPAVLHKIGEEFRGFEEFEIGNHRRWQEGIPDKKIL